MESCSFFKPACSEQAPPAGPWALCLGSLEEPGLGWGHLVANTSVVNSVSRFLTLVTLCPAVVTFSFLKILFIYF